MPELAALRILMLGGVPGRLEPFVGPAEQETAGQARVFIARSELALGFHPLPCFLNGETRPRPARITTAMAMTGFATPEMEEELLRRGVAVVITAADRRAFKRCRRAWDFGSPQADV